MKKTHKFTSDQKISWFGYGEWVEEPDSVDFTFKGYKCLVNRVVIQEPCAESHMFGGHLCGYISIPEWHPFFNKEEIDIECHGGITFNKGNVIGFDCAHSCDYVPSMELMKKQIKYSVAEMFPIPEEFKQYAIFNPVYRNIDFCIYECKIMARQLNKAVILAKNANGEK